MHVIMVHVLLAIADAASHYTYQLYYTTIWEFIYYNPKLYVLLHVLDVNARVTPTQS